MTTTPTIAANHTRYNTDDLQALIDFCVKYATMSGYGKIPATFTFFEYRPRGSGKNFRMSAFKKGANQYGGVYLSTKVRWSKTQRDQPGVVWIAAPESWMGELAQLAVTGTNDVIQLPAEGVLMLADSIKSFWHYSNVCEDLTLGVRVSAERKKAVRASTTAVVKENKYVSQCTTYIEAVRAATQALSTVAEMRHRISSAAAAVSLGDPLLHHDVVGGCRELKTRLEASSNSVSLSVGKLNNRVGGTR